MACDYVINIKIADDNQDGFATMTGPLTKGCYDVKYRGMDSAEVYNMLKQDPPQDGGDGGSGGDGQSLDEHGWDDAGDDARRAERTGTRDRRGDTPRRARCWQDWLWW